ncbi:MAG: FHA domain-containing protein, partial [Magnetococcales bacterium]|nr:FHA domain-containing protein [Magnetococcales bacterium]
PEPPAAPPVSPEPELPPEPAAELPPEAPLECGTVFNPPPESEPMTPECGTVFNPPPEPESPPAPEPELPRVPEPPSEVAAVASPEDGTLLAPGPGPLGDGGNLVAPEGVTLLIQGGTEPHRAIPLAVGRHRLGRGEGVEVPLDNKFISREHLTLTVEETGVALEVLSSKGGVKVNHQPVDRTRLRDRDRIELYPYFLELRSTRTVDRAPSSPGQAETLPPVRLVNTANGTMFPLTQEVNVLGRVPESAVFLESPFVSRQHAEIRLTGENVYQLTLLNTAKSVSVNGTPVTTRRLFHGDRITIEDFTLVFTSERPEDGRDPAGEATIYRGAEPGPGFGGGTPSAPSAGDEERTIMAGHGTAPPPQVGPRLIRHRANRPDETLPIRHPEITVGRAADCDLHLDDPTVSKHHLQLTQRPEGIFAQPAAETVRVLINGKPATEPQQIFNGDRLQLGDALFSFLSDRPEDQRPEAPPEAPPQPPSRAPLLLLLAAGVAGVGYLAWNQWVEPARLEALLTEAAPLAEADQYEKAAKTLEPTLLPGVREDIVERGRKLLARAIFLRVKNWLEGEKLAEAKDFLVQYLRSHGGGEETDALWAILDQLRLNLGKQHEKESRPSEAMREYLAIRSESAQFPEAQQAISRLWLEQQKGRAAADQGRSVAALLEKAEAAFSRQNYLTPPEDNAYTFFRMALAHAPENAPALSGLERIKSVYRESGEARFNAKEFAQAREEFQRLLVMDPANEEARRRLAEVDQSLEAERQAKRQAEAKARPAEARSDGKGEAKPAAEAKSDGKAAARAAAASKQEAARQERVRKLLEEQGVESNWIMDYLFTDQPGQAGSQAKPEDSPWK